MKDVNGITSPSTDFTDNERREKLKRDLEGQWEYCCKTHKGNKAANEADTFSNDEIERGGVITIVVSNNGWAGLSAGITGHRLWAKKATERKPFGLKERLIWNATGGVVADDKKLQFTYSSGHRFGAGLTTDTFFVESEEKDFNLTPGKFIHYRDDGKRVGGEVKLRKMKHSDDLKWAPRGIHFIPK